MHRPEATPTAVLFLGLVALGVVTYPVSRQTREVEHELERVQAEAVRMGSIRGEQDAVERFKAVVLDDLISGRKKLPDAAEIVGSAQQHDTRFSDTLALYFPGPTRKAQVAFHLIRMAHVRLECTPSKERAVIVRLLREYRLAFGEPIGPLASFAAGYAETADTAPTAVVPAPRAVRHDRPGRAAPRCHATEPVRPQT